MVRGTEGTRDDLPNAELPLTARRLDWVRFAVLLWASAALALLARAGWGWAQLARAARIARPVVDAEWQRLLADLIVELRIARRVRLLQGDEPGVPVTWGVLRPCILIPPDASSWPAAQRRAVLLHELAHVERLDAFTQLLASISCALHWPNPLTWLAARRMRLLREGMAADVVVFDPGAVADHATYADGKQLAAGMDHVVVNGEAVLVQGNRTAALPGRARGKVVVVMPPSQT